MTIKTTKRKNVLRDQETNIAITINTTFRLKSFINYKNECLELHNCDGIVLEKRITNVHVKKDDNYEIKLRDYEKRNVYYRTRDQTIKKIL